MRYKVPLPPIPRRHSQLTLLALTLDVDLLPSTLEVLIAIHHIHSSIDIAIVTLLTLLWISL